MLYLIWRKDFLFWASIHLKPAIAEISKCDVIWEQQNYLTQKTLHKFEENYKV